MVAKCYGILLGDVAGCVSYLYVYFNLGNHRQTEKGNVNGFVIKCP